MFADHFFQPLPDGRSPVGHATHQTRAAPIFGEPIIVQPQSPYFLATGADPLRVLTGQRDLPDPGRLTARAPRALGMAWLDGELRHAGRGPVVFTIASLM